MVAMHRSLAAACALYLIVAAGVFAQQNAPFAGLLDEHPLIQYETRPTRDRVAALSQAVTTGTVALRYDERSGYLGSVLDALKVPAESQLLVFSKTGIQGAHTSPTTPRAIFFNDTVAVGFIPGARVLEVAAQDPEQGVQFYTIDQAAGGRPTIKRQLGCITCHISSSTLDVPGMLNRSVFARADGSVLAQLGNFTVNHTTRLLDRWGGMYVSGNYHLFPYNVAVHMGNTTTSVSESAGPVSSNEAFIAWTNSRPEARGYPSIDSDITAFMAFDHQVHAINLLTRVNWEARANGRWQLIADQLADYLLFVGEVPPPAKVSPRTGFAEAFAAGVPRDRQGRSLRDLDMETRLLKYPCSYMIYAQAFDTLSPAVKSAIYRRMWTLLSGQDKTASAHLSTADRRAIIEILRDTKKDLPAEFAQPQWPVASGR
jgi:hypothetical protein